MRRGSTRGREGDRGQLVAIDAAIGTLQRLGRPAGNLATDEAMARRYLAMRVGFVAVGVDATLLAQATRTLAARFKATPGGPTPTSGT